MNKTTPCPICHSERIRFLFEGWDLILGYPDSALVYQCYDCEHIFVAGTLTPEQLTDMYTNYYPRADFNVEDYKPHQEKSGFLYWLDGEEGYAYRHVPKDVRVLDIGCGYCETLGYHKARGCEVYGVESDENTRKIAERYGFNVEIGLFDPKKYEPESFDYITMNEVLEHVVDPLQTLKEISVVLKLGGFFVAYVPNPKSLAKRTFGKRWGTWHLPFHRHFYSRQAIEILAQQSGFTIHKMKSATESKRLLDLWGYYFYAGKPRQKARELVQLTGRVELASTDVKKQGVTRLYTFLRKIRFLCLSMRIADMFGVGDMNLIILEKNPPATSARR